ncbi:MAG: transcription elongation factor GreA [Rickettsiales bacterium]|jgi:transcription elongation factor GreA|nr:transcription elongation factor GreA [Rickettsiales bacterium]
MEKKPVSKKGYERALAELKDLNTNQKPENDRVLAWARSLGDLSENADYSAAKEKQRMINRRIGFLEDLIKNAEVIDTENLSGNRVIFGAHVTATDDDGNSVQCQILSEFDADGKNIIACTSPMGRAMIGKCVGDTCFVRTPSGDKEYEIVEVKFDGK